MSYLLASITRRDLFLRLHRCEPMFVPLEKLFFGTDYPGFGYDPVALAEQVRSVNQEAPALGMEPIPQRKIDGLLGDNFRPRPRPRLLTTGRVACLSSVSG